MRTNRARAGRLSAPILFALALLLVACAAAPPDDRARARAELGRSGVLRAAINFGNPILASRSADGRPRGVSVDIANEVGRRLGVQVELVPFESAGKVVDAVKAGQVDLAFVAIDPVRAADMEYTAPYVAIEGAYLVRADSPLQRNDEVDRAGVRVAVGRGSAYDLFLSRALRAATLVRVPTSPVVTDEFLGQGLDVAAGVKQQLEADAKRVGGVRLLPGRFMVIEQALGVPKGRLAAREWLALTIEALKASGFVAAALAQHGIEGALVAPPARASPGAAGGAAPAVAAGAEHCDYAVRIEPQYDAAPRTLAVQVTFAADGRTESDLLVNEGWSGIDNLSASLEGWRGADAATRVEATSRPSRWHVTHPASGLVSVALRARASLADPDGEQPQAVDESYRTQIGRDWFQFFGHSAIPMPAHWSNEWRGDLCITVSQPGHRDAAVLGSHGWTHGAEVTLRLHGGRRQLLQAFYAGGDGWRLVEHPLTDGVLRMALRGRYAADDLTLADKAAALIDAERRFWKDEDRRGQSIVVTPNHGNGSSAGTVVENVTVLNVGPTFAPAQRNFDFLIGHENQHQWIPLRLGAVSTDGSEATTWLAEGFTDYYTHRLLLASGLWSRAQYAAALTRTLRFYWQSPSRNEPLATMAPRYFSDRDAGSQLYARGELLAMRWHLALREAGRPGLDAVMRSLILPPGADSRSAPLVTERLFTALQPLLGAAPRLDAKRYIDEGESFPLVAGLAGPCFDLRWDDVPRWVRGFDARSYVAHKAIGVVVDGPAHRAGLREGMELLEWATSDDESSRELSLTVRSDGQTKLLRYLATDGSSDRLPTLRPAATAAGDDSACARWAR